MLFRAIQSGEAHLLHPLDLQNGSASYSSKRSWVQNANRNRPGFSMHLVYLFFWRNNSIAGPYSQCSLTHKSGSVLFVMCCSQENPFPFLFFQWSASHETRDAASSHMPALRPRRVLQSALDYRQHARSLDHTCLAVPAWNMSSCLLCGLCIPSPAFWDLSHCALLGVE